MDKTAVPKKNLIWPRALILIFCLGAYSLVSCGESIEKPAAVSAPPGVETPGDFVRASEVNLPASLGTIQDRFEGKPGQPVIFVIGENHVSLPVQRAVVDILSYLRSAYEVKTICSEGMEGPLPVPAVNEPFLARRLAAESELLARHINGVAYMALAYPDVRVIGVEDMRSYNEHKEAIRGTPPELEAWINDLQSFFSEDAARLPEPGASQVSEALLTFNSDHDLDAFLGRLEAVDSNSEAGQKLTALLERKKTVMAAAKQRASDRTRGEDPQMARRDVALVNASISNLWESGPLALVVGSLHLPGITSRLRSAGVPFVSILVAGVPLDPLQYEPGVDDAKVYTSWEDEEPTGLEAWLTQMNPPSTMLREPLREKIALLGALVNAGHMLRKGNSEAEVRAVLLKANLLKGFDINQTYPIPGGHGIRFVVAGKTGYFYVSSQSLPLFQENHPDRIESGASGGQHWAVFDGGGGKKPPVPPPSSPSSSEPPGGDFGRRFGAAVDEQNRKKGHAATVAFIVDDGMVFRRSGSYWLALGISAEELRKLVADFRAAKPGPERLLAAHHLAAALLTGIDEDLPRDRKDLHVVAQDDLLGDISLPAVAALAAEPGTTELGKMEGVYTLSWQDVQKDMGALDWSAKPVDIRSTVVWIAPSLRKSDQEERIISTWKEVGVRVDEAPRAGDTLILLGGAKDETFLLRNGIRVSSGTAAFKSALQSADAVVAFNIAIPAPVSERTTQLHVQEVAGQDTLPAGRKLVERIREKSGKKTLDEILREKAAEKRSEARKNEARINNLRKNLSTGFMVEVNRDTKATQVHQAK